MSLLRYWPKVNSPKEVMFLNEVEEVVEKMDSEYFQLVGEREGGGLVAMVDEAGCYGSFWVASRLWLGTGLVRVVGWLMVVRWW